MKRPVPVMAPLLALALLAPAGPAAAQSPEAQSATVVYLVRHAEKADQGDDPGLTPTGQSRARRLVLMLRGAGLTHVHTTDYARTRETAAPVANALGLDAVLYDPRDLAGFAAELKATPGRHLVVGHSNTTPELVRLLGGAPAGPMSEHEYDRVYVLTLEPEAVRTAILGYPTDPIRPDGT